MNIKPRTTKLDVMLHQKLYVVEFFCVASRSILCNCFDTRNISERSKGYFAQHSFINRPYSSGQFDSFGLWSFCTLKMISSSVWSQSLKKVKIKFFEWKKRGYQRVLPFQTSQKMLCATFERNFTSKVVKQVAFFSFKVDILHVFRFKTMIFSLWTKHINFSNFWRTSYLSQRVT